jgi:hypothetical protein
MKRNLIFLIIYLTIGAIICQFFSGHELLKSFLFLGCLLIIPWYFRKDKYILLALLGGLIIALIISYWAPYPYIHDTDVFRHVSFINKILAGEFFWGQPAYFGILHNFLALVALLFNFESFPYAIFWSARFVVFPLYSLGMYLFIKQAINNKPIALFSAIVAPLTTIEFLSLINFAPKIISLVLLPYLLYWILKVKKINWKIILAITVIALSAHFYMGAVNLFVIFSYLIYKKYFNKKIIYLISGLALFFILLQAVSILNLSQTSISIFGEVDLSHYNFYFNWTRFLEYFPVFIIFIASMGLIMRRTDKNALAFYPPLFIILAAYFFPLNASYRILASIVPIIILLCAFFILDFSNWLENKKKKKIFIFFIFLILFIFFCLPYYNKITKNITLPNNENKFSIITPDEFKTAQWLRDNSYQDILIVSDPVNAWAISALSKNEMILAPEEIIEKIMAEKDPEIAYQFIKQKEKEYNKKIGIFIDGRTTFWIKNKKDNEILISPNQAKKFEEFKGLNKFFNNQYFNVQYFQENKYYLIEIK